MEEDSKIEDKINNIEKYLEELPNIVPAEFEEYRTNFAKKAACERCAEIIIEAVADLAFLVIKKKNLKVPEEDKEAFEILAGEKIITNEIASRFREAKGMRNILAHEYGKVDDAIVFHAVSEELVKDSRAFIDAVNKYLK